MVQSKSTREPVPTKTPTAEQQQIEVENEANQRANACWEEIQAVARKHSCRLEASINPELEPVGRYGNRVQIQAVLQVIPLVKQ